MIKNENYIVIMLNPSIKREHKYYNTNIKAELNKLKDTYKKHKIFKSISKSIHPHDGGNYMLPHHLSDMFRLRVMSSYT